MFYEMKLDITGNICKVPPDLPCKFHETSIS